MKKLRILYIIISNLIIILMIFIIFEKNFVRICKDKYPGSEYKITNTTFDELVSGYKYREPIDKQYKKRPIILLGCSFAYGYQLKENETFGYKISKLTKRPVYNYGITGKGLQTTLYLLEKNILSPDIKNPEYAIYIMMNDQVRRLYSAVNMTDTLSQPDYKHTKKGELVLKSNSNPKYKQLCTYYFVNNLLFNYVFEKMHKKNNLIINTYFKEINKRLKEKYPNIKFVILLYGNEWNYWMDLSPLKKDNITVIHTKELTGIDLFQRKYWQADNDMHPNGAAWDEVAPALKKELKL